MAKWLKDYLSFGSRRMPPQPPKPDYTESEILKAYRAQKKLDFEDPYEDSENRARNESGSSDSSYPAFGSPLKSASLDMKVVSPKHRLIKVDSQELGRTKILLSAVSLEEQEPVSHFSCSTLTLTFITITKTSPLIDKTHKQVTGNVSQKYAMFQYITPCLKWPVTWLA